MERYIVLAVILVTLITFSGCAERQMLSEIDSSGVTTTYPESTDAITTPFDTRLVNENGEIDMSDELVSNLTEFDPEKFVQPINLEFVTISLDIQELPSFDVDTVGSIVQTIELGFGTQVMYKSGAATTGNEQLYSYLEVNDIYYDLTLYPDSPYDAGVISETNIKAPYKVYSYDIGLGANYIQRQYIFVENGIAYLIAHIDSASEEDVDNDGWDETIYQHGLPMNTLLYVWDIENGIISYADLNSALNSTSVFYDHLDGLIMFVAQYLDTAKATTRNVTLRYTDGMIMSQNED